MPARKHGCEAVAEIRHRWDTRVTIRSLAVEYNYSPRTIREILYNREYRPPLEVEVALTSEELEKLVKFEEEGG
jgi:hypothetical protein